MSGPPRLTMLERVVLVVALVFAALVLLASLLGCGGAARRQQASEPVDGAPSVHDISWSHAPDLRTPIAEFPWCADPQGHNATYPCKWDIRERPAPTWDAQAAPVAVWVWRGYPCPIGKVKTSDDNSVAWACYYGPGPAG